MKIILPLTLIIPRKTKEDKVFALNLNTYRNTHHMTMNQAKILWVEVVRNAVRGRVLTFLPPYKFTYTIFPGSARAFDIPNVAPAIEKFTDDALQEIGIIANDNYRVLPGVDYRFGSIDKGNPRCELVISKYDPSSP
jgi:hypothetical protein